MAVQVDQSGLIMLAALEQRETYSTALIMALAVYPQSVTVEIILEWNVLVGCYVLNSSIYCDDYYHTSIHDSTSECQQLH